MCLIAFAYKVSAEYPLILIANRDEFHKRPAQKAHFWTEDKEVNILAGRDLEGGGTWFGIGETGKWAAVTNHRDIENIKQFAPTRGNLIPQFLKSTDSAENYLQHLQKDAAKYNGFNLLLGDKHGVFHYSNISNSITKIEAGIHGVSNALLNTPWPKLVLAKDDLKKEIEKDNFDHETLFSILKNENKAEVNHLPETGLDEELEMALSSIFIDIDNYGTRCSTLLLISKNGDMKFVERTYDSENTSNVDDVVFEI
ncbi:NRDE family protein [Brumimicrobium mesophilum]|uniref:NRDE family protein n=1 Tax=Brumimicrobium mesophilum TaxID=392717 RepID=UPI000D144D87|nr:NRDE family protein [Brumimicrobium mesophilum]